MLFAVPAFAPDQLNVTLEPGSPVVLDTEIEVGALQSLADAVLLEVILADTDNDVILPPLYDTFRPDFLYVNVTVLLAPDGLEIVKDPVAPTN